MKRFKMILPALLGVLCVADMALAQHAAKPAREIPTFLDSRSAGPDYAAQGEYAGELAGGKGKLAAQVIALGDDKFQAIFMQGGLPGDGWDGKSRTAVDGARTGEKVSFTGAFAASIENGVLSGKTQAGESFSLKRIERVSPDEGKKPPQGAIVLFDGTSTDAWDEHAKIDDRRLLQAGTKTRQKFQDFSLHAEFLLPFKPKGRDQDRGNSGIYIQDRYEVQILDTFGHPPEFNGIASTYRQTAPTINMCYPPLRWQTYDIDFSAAKFDDNGKKTKNAAVTVRHNGVIVQNHTELKDKTGAGQKEGPQPGPIQLQGHGNPVFFRNVWVVDQK